MTQTVSTNDKKIHLVPEKEKTLYKILEPIKCINICTTAMRILSILQIHRKVLETIPTKMASDK